MTHDAPSPTDRLRKAYQQLDAAAELARAVHRAAAPVTLPDLPPLRFAAAARAKAAVFDVWPAGAGRVTAFLALAAGHGGAGELLGLLVKQAVAVEDLRSAGEMPPGEVLGRVNRLLLGLGLPDPPFVSMAVAKIDRGTGEVAVARAAVPNPVAVPAAGPVEAWPTPGPLLGVFEAEFPTRTGRLAPGDKLLLATGGDDLPALADRHRQLAVGMFADAVVTTDSAVLVVEHLA